MVPASVQALRGPIQNRFTYRLEDIKTLTTFVNYIVSFLRDTWDQYEGVEDVLRLYIPAQQSFFVSSGLSFSVHARGGRQLPPEINKLFPERPVGKHQTVATKRPKTKHEIAEEDIFAEDARAFQAIAWECHVLWHPSISRSKNVVNLLDVSWEKILNQPEPSRILPSLVMEFADEGTLEDLLQFEKYSLLYQMKRKLVLDVAYGLDTIHRCGIIHSGIKCRNILLFNDETEALIAKVTDFGCSLHDFGPYDRICLPGYSPPWDAPETRHGLSQQLNYSKLTCIHTVYLSGKLC